MTIAQPLPEPRAPGRRRLPDPRSDDEIAARMNDLEARMRPYESLGRDGSNGTTAEPLYLAFNREWLALERELTHRHVPASALAQDDGSEPF